MPPAWRALDRLREISKDWEQLQQPLANEDITVLMEHKEVFTERTPVVRKGRTVEVESSISCSCATSKSAATTISGSKECVAYSALVHDVYGRWAMKTLFPRIASPTARASAMTASSGPSKRGA